MICEKHKATDIPPKKSSYIKANQKLFMTSEFNKSVWTVTLICVIDIRNLRASETIRAFAKQPDKTITSPKACYNQLYLKHITGNKQFRCTVTPLLSNDNSEIFIYWKQSDYIWWCTSEKNQIISDDKVILWHFL